MIIYAVSGASIYIPLIAYMRTVQHAVLYFIKLINTHIYLYIYMYYMYVCYETSAVYAYLYHSPHHG